MGISSEKIDEEILKRSQQEFNRTNSPPKGFEDLPEITAERYINEEFNNLEKEAIWNKCWLYSAHTDQLKSPGDYILWKDSGVPIIIVRSEDDEIKAFYNTYLL